MNEGTHQLIARARGIALTVRKTVKSTGPTPSPEELRDALGADAAALLLLTEMFAEMIEALIGPRIATDADLIRIHAREVYRMAKGHDLPITVRTSLHCLGAALGEEEWP